MHKELGLAMGQRARSKMVKSAQGTADVLRSMGMPEDLVARVAKTERAQQRKFMTKVRQATQRGVKKTLKTQPSSVLRTLGGAGLGVGIVGGLYGAEKAIGAIYRAASYKKDFENMMSFAPEIKKFDKEQVKARFDTLRKFNPKMSRDPLVASSWIKQTIEYPVVTPATLKDVTEREQPLVSAVGRALPRMEV
jgi:hypothetical protein